MTNPYPYTVTYDPLRALSPFAVSLTGTQAHPTANHGGSLKACRFVVMHYTAGPSLERAIERFVDPQSEASAHLVIGPSGSATQMVSLDKVAWHAGQSTWRPRKNPGRILGLRGLNSISIGIEIVNAGPLKASKNGKFHSWWGKEIPPEEVVEIQGRFWHKFSEAQLATCEWILQELFRSPLGIEELLGHADIAPGRKEDPGPAFPIEHFRALLQGRKR